MLLLSDGDVLNLLLKLSPKQCEQLLLSLEGILKIYSVEQSSQQAKSLHQPHRSSIINKHNDTTLVMPSSDTVNTAVKVVTLPNNGPATGAILLMEAGGRVLGMLAAAQVTAFRTALTVMSLFVRANHIPKKNILCFGSGKQVEWHIHLLLILAPTEIENITIINRSQSRLNQLQNSLAPLRSRWPQVKFQFIAREEILEAEIVLQRLLADSDVIFCCTPSTAPLFPFEYLSSAPKPRFISAIGSYKPHMMEIDEETLLSGAGTIFVDSKEACLQESGELIAAKVKVDDLIELGELLALDGKSLNLGPGNVVFKCVGMGAMDLAISRTLLEIAEASGVGAQAEGF